MAFQFENTDVAAKYESTRSVDGKVHVPAGKKTAANPNPIGYSGPLSKISLAAADKDFASGNNILKLKETVAKPIKEKESIAGKNGLSTT